MNSTNTYSQDPGSRKAHTRQPKKRRGRHRDKCQVSKSNFQISTRLQNPNSRHGQFFAGNFTQWFCSGLGSRLLELVGELEIWNLHLILILVSGAWNLLNRHLLLRIRLTRVRKAGSRLPTQNGVIECYKLSLCFVIIHSYGPAQTLENPQFSLVRFCPFAGVRLPLLFGPGDGPC